MNGTMITHQANPKQLEHSRARAVHGRMGGLLRATVALTFTALAACLLFAPIAWGAAAPELLLQVGSAGQGAGQLSGVFGVANDPINGHLFAAEHGNSRISEFTSWGQFVKAFGWDVAPGGVNEQQEVRVRASSGQFRLSYGAGGQGVGETTDISVGASAGAVQSALNSLSNISAAGGAVTVSANPGRVDGSVAYVYVIAFTAGPLKEADVAQIAATNGTTPLSGGAPTTVLEAGTRADGTAGGTGLEACTAESGCKTGTAGSAAGQTEAPLGIAVDSAHDIYVVEQENHRVEKFDSAGRFLLMFGKDVNSGTSGDPNLCTNAGPPTDVCGPGSTGTGPGEFSPLPAFTGELSFIAIGPADKVYVGDANRIEKFSSAGVYESEIPLPGKGLTQALAIDSEGDLYVASESEPGVVSRYDSSGAPKDFATGPGAGTNKIEVQNEEGHPSGIRGLAMDGADNLYVDDENSHQVNQAAVPFYEVLGFDASGAPLFAPFLSKVTTSTGIGFNTEGDVYVGDAYAQTAKVNIFGPVPTYESPPDVAPGIESESISSVGVDEATVEAEIKPHFWPTRYYVQYGPNDCALSACAEQPIAPGDLLSVQRGTGIASVTLSDLNPGTTYHYRFVAESEAPESGGPVFGQDHTLRTRSGTPATGLPDGRVYEMVTPSEKENAEVGVPSRPAGQVEFKVVKPRQSSPDGERFTYTSFTSFGDGEGAPSASQFISRRGPAGWLTENINPHFEEAYLRDPFVGFSEDLEHGAVSSFTPPLAGEGEQPFTWNLYARDNGSGDYTALTPVQPEASEVGAGACLGFSGASENFDRVIFAARSERLAPGDPLPGVGAVNLYEWTPGGGIALASVLPGGGAATPQSSTSFGASYTFVQGQGGTRCGMEPAPMRHAISRDGKRMFWTYPTTLASPLAQGPVLFARLIRPGGPETVELDAKQGGSAITGGKGVYRDASVDGSKVFFTTNNKLAKGPGGTEANGTDLYRYDIGKYEAGEPDPLANLTAHSPEAANVQGVLGVSAKGDYVYFAAQGVLSTVPNSHGDTAQPGQSNVYAWHEGDPAFHFVATVPDSNNWSANPSEQTARVSPDGLHLAFTSTAPLTGFDNTLQGGEGAATEVFVYDLEDEELDCASCNSTGARPLGSSSVPVWSTPFEQPRYIGDSGRLFFQSKDALDPNDTNGKQDVYEFERAGQGSCTTGSLSYSSTAKGCQFLISSGTSSDESYFMDASTDGRDVFIATRQRLVPQLDEGDAFDVYDARIGGNPYVSSPPPCEGEACLGAGTHPGASPAAGTASFSGHGNLKADRGCPKGKRKVRRRGKVRCLSRRRHAHRRHHHHGHHKRTTHHKRRAGR